MTLASECGSVRIFGQLDHTAVKQRADLIFTATKHMSPQRWVVERIAAPMKWFDYRFLSPLQATELFVEEYRRVYQLKWSQNFDSGTAHLKRGTAAGGLFHSRKEFSEFWNARLHADLMGVPYEFYISTAMEVALRRAKQTRLPRAGQLRRKDCIQAVDKGWDEELARNRWFSELPQYRAENDHGLPDQITHQDYVARVALKRSNGLLALGAAIDNRRILPVKKAETAHGIELVLSARERITGSGTLEPVETLTAEQLIPSCFGLPAPLDVAAEPCSRCPLAAQCQQASERLLADVVDQYGSENPMLQHIRTSGAERARRCREKKKRLARAAAIQQDIVISLGAA